MPEVQQKNRLNSISYLRAVAVIAVLFVHMIGFRDRSWFVYRYTEKLVITPLKFAADFGAFGVCLFFLISGFLIMETNINSKSSWLKILKKIIFIYLSTVASFAVFGIVQFIANKFTTTYWARYSLSDWLWSSSLLCYFKGVGEVISGTTWFLLPLFFFYVFSILILYVGRKNIKRALILANAIPVICMGGGMIMKHCNHDHLLLQFLPFVFIPVAGVILWAIVRQKATLKFGIAMLVVNYAFLVFSFYKLRPDLYGESSYLVSFAYAALLLLLFVTNEKHFVQNDIIDFIGRISLPAYLVHQMWGGWFIGIGYQKLPYTIVEILSWIGVLAVALFHEEYIDDNIKRFLFSKEKVEEK